MNLLGTISFAAGAILIYGAVKDKTPVQVFKDLQTGGKATPKTSAPAPSRAGGGPNAPVARLRTGV